MLECIITQECGGNNSHSSVAAFMANIPQSFGKYRILEEIARGSFGRVYRGEDTSRHNHPVAIKVMHAAHLASPQERSTFLQEAQLLTMLRHPHIVPVLDVASKRNFLTWLWSMPPTARCISACNRWR